MAIKKEKLSLEKLLEQALVKDEDKPYEVPGNWVWTKLGIVCSVNPPKIISKSFPDDLDVSFIPMAAVSEISGSVIVVETRKLHEVKNGYTNFVNNDILFAKITPCMENGKSAIAINLTNGIGYGSTEFHVLRVTNCVLNKFIFYLVRAKWFREDARLHMSGSVGQQRVPKHYLENYNLPLPPLPEQQRIVTLIESLFEKLDRAKELAQNALDSFENRKSAILHKAFTGELTRKWRDKHQVDAPSKIYNTIKEQHDMFGKVGKAQNEISQLFDKWSLDDNLSDNGWIKLRAMMFCDTITCGNTPTGNISSVGEIPFLKVYNIINNRIDFDYKPQFIDRNTHTTKLKSSMLLPDDVVMNIVGPPLRKIAIIPNDYPSWSMNQAIVRFRP